MNLRITGGQPVDPSEFVTPAPAIPPDPWKHRSDGMKCATCMFFVEKQGIDAHGKRTIGRCRRHAPTMSGFPVVFETDWCGDHKLDETKV